jgi:hypothetical protein
MTRACPSRCGWLTNVKLTAWISFTLHCIRLLMAQSRHPYRVGECPLSGVKRTSKFKSVTSAFDPNETYVPQNCCYARKRGEPGPAPLSVNSIALSAFLFIADPATATEHRHGALQTLLARSTILLSARPSCHNNTAAGCPCDRRIGHGPAPRR